MLLFSSDGVGLLDHMVDLFLFFLRTRRTVFHSGITNLHFPQFLLGTRALFSLHPHQHLLFVIFLMIAILNDISLWFDLHSFLWLNNVEHLFLGLFAICVSFLKKCLFMSSAHF